MKLKEEFQIHDTLNPKLWNGDQLLPEVRDKLIEIAEEFEKYIQVPIRIVDLQLCGSNASFNYTEYSDLDLHVIANFEVLNLPDEILQTLYDVKKSEFNREFDISIHGIEVELYVQDIRSNVVSNGIYSICDENWVKVPKPMNSATKHNIENDLEKWKRSIELALSSNNLDTVMSSIDRLYLMRKNSIAADGEYSKGNELFKAIRNLGLITKLKDRLSELMSNKLTLESFSGVFVNRFEE